MHMMLMLEVKGQSQ